MVVRNETSKIGFSLPYFNPDEERPPTELSFPRPPATAPEIESGYLKAAMKSGSRTFAAIPKAISLALAFGFSLIGLLAFFSFTPSLVVAQSGAWATAPSMPTARYGLTSCVVNGKIYAIGGANVTNDSLATVEVFDPSTNSWSTGPSMPTAREALTSCVVNGKIYAIGGDDYNGRVLATVEVFDPSTNTWSKGPSMPTSFSRVTSSVVSSKIYVIGGMLGSYLTVNSVEVFDPSTNSWSTGPLMSTPRYGLTSSVINGKIYAIGGIDNNGYNLGTVEVFDPSTNSWSTGPLMPTPRYGLTSNPVNGKIYAIGGEERESFGPTYTTYTSLATVDVFDPSAAGVVANHAGIPELTAYPNPTSTSETLLYSLADESSVSITVFDALGRVVSRPVVGEMESAGMHQYSFDTKDLPPSLYSCRLSAGWTEMFAKIVVAR